MRFGAYYPALKDGVNAVLHFASLPSYCFWVALTLALKDDARHTRWASFRAKAPLLLVALTSALKDGVNVLVFSSSRSWVMLQNAF
ncbi:MAG: hypothetical protein J0L94_04275 [Rhodothermia bacterium]|nr:hypothetical protein [Rhodothermia bacterium]